MKVLTADTLDEVRDELEDAGTLSYPAFDGSGLMVFRGDDWFLLGWGEEL